MNIAIIMTLKVSNYIILFIVIIFVSNFMQGIYNYIPETNVFLRHIMLELLCIYKLRYIQDAAEKPDGFRMK